MYVCIRATSCFHGHAPTTSKLSPPPPKPQGFDVSQTAKGVRVLLDFAAEIEKALQEPTPRVTVIDIGGGLSANYGSDEAKPSHAQLCATLREVNEI